MVVMDVAYFDFDLALERTEEGLFVHALASPLGEAIAPFTPPFTRQERAQLLQATANLTLDAATPAPPLLRSAGEQLFVAVFRERVGICFQNSYQLAYQGRMGLRIRLHLMGLPEASEWPWEYLFDPARNEFLALSIHSPVIRYVGLMHRIPPLKVTPPLRMLVVMASPGRYPPFDVDETWTALLDQLDHLAMDGKMTIDRLAKPTLHDLQRRLRERQYHILHFIGHGHFDTQMQEGYLLFEDEMGRSRPVNGQHLGAILRDHFALRLVVLEACANAQLLAQNPYASVAQSVVQRGLPAAVALQVKLPEGLDLPLLDAFYSAVAEQVPLDLALTTARRAVYADSPTLAWGAPILVMRVPDGKLFDGLTTPAAPPRPEAPSLLRSLVRKFR
jgi:hypothetical protein